MSTLFESTVEEIFTKFDVKQTGILNYDLFKAFTDTIGRHLNPNIFEELCKQFDSTYYSQQAQSAMKARKSKSEIMVQI